MELDDRPLGSSTLLRCRGRLNMTAAVSNEALTLALEATESVGARDALERNLMHQAMVAQQLGMAMAAKAHRLTAMVGGLESEREISLALQVGFDT